MKPGLYDIPPAVYYSDGLTEEPSLNATVLKAFIADSPLHGWTTHPKLNPDHAEKASDSFDLGTAAHALFLQGELITETATAFSYNNDAVATALLVRVDGKPFALVADEKEWRSNAAKAVRDEAHHRGLIALKIADWNRTRALAPRIRERTAGIITHPEPALFTAGRAERTLVWRDRGVLCRARLDWLHDSLECVDDLKTTGRSANPHVWSRVTFAAIGADIQAAFTLRGLKAAAGVESTFRFALAEIAPPYAVAAVTPSAQALDFANRRIDAALERWKRCVADDEWPAFPDRVLTIDPPPWAEMQYAEAQQVEEAVAAA